MQMKKIVQIILILLIPEILIFTLIVLWNPDKIINSFDKSTIYLSNTDNIPVDHSKFYQLQQNFESAQDVTKACLECHNNVDVEFMKSGHWNWLSKDSLSGEKSILIGKRNVLNNFCIGINSNEKLCSKCHAGYSFYDNNFDFSASENIDCIICHDKTGTYKKSKVKPGGGLPDSTIDLILVAQNVGYTGRGNCGSCHYYGGGGNNVKHGDLEVALNSCTREIDVHMDENGPNMTCTECHQTINHNIKGVLSSVSVSPQNSFSCTDCHTTKPHNSKILNEHYNQVACQTCHIPTYAKSAPTKMDWDWSTAGKMDSIGKYLEYEEIISEDSILKYDSKHGTGIYVKNLKPDYMWHNGYTKHFMLSDSILSDSLTLNNLLGSYEDNLRPKDKNNPSKIYPVKIMRGKQIYDPVYMKLIQPKLLGKKGSGAFWSDYNWDSSAVKGMQYMNLKYSGKHDFINTKSYWPINHMVAAKENTLSCEDCHAKNGRLENLTEFYLPGRDKSLLIEIGGILMIIMAFVAVSIHGIIRIIKRKDCK